MNELDDELRLITDVCDDLEDEIAHIEDGPRKKALEFALREAQVQQHSLKAEVAQREELQRNRDLARSPEGRLLYAVAEAFQFDYLSDEDIEHVLKMTKEKLAKQGLQLKVVALDDME